jgi:hypothetical protein
MRRDGALLAASGLVAAGVADSSGLICSVLAAGPWRARAGGLGCRRNGQRPRFAWPGSGPGWSARSMRWRSRTRPPPRLDERVAGAIEGARRFGSRIKLLSDSFRDQRDK